MNLLPGCVLKPRRVLLNRLWNAEGVEGRAALLAVEEARSLIA